MFNQSIIQDANQIIRASIEAVLPDAAVERALKNHEISRPVTLISLGKAGWRMADAAYRVLGADKVKQGVVVTKYDHCEGPIGCMELYESGHPVPDENGVKAAARVLEMVRTLTAEDEVILLISGGGSALFEYPAEGVTLGEIADITKQLLACGADITEINCIRKRLSGVKGGKLALTIAPAKTFSIILSDVLGDPLDAIASGPAYPDQTTCEDAKAIVEKYGLKLNDEMLAAIEIETPKELPCVNTFIAGNVKELCATAAREAEKLGYAAKVMDEGLCCEARQAGAMMSKHARETEGPCALIWGGETVVYLKGQGKGGRNQEVALSAAEGIAGMENVCVFALGSDGTDGPTDAAGGMVTGEFYAKATAERVRAHLENNDAYPLLRDMDALIMTGPTGTNVNDLYMLIKR
ncbi:MAG: glycerate kinase [Clostridia bacterium]|nr:glycerate kinase [Clostridia bacterium]